MQELRQVLERMERLRTQAQSTPTPASSKDEHRKLKPTEAAIAICLSKSGLKKHERELSLDSLDVFHHQQKAVDVLRNIRNAVAAGKQAHSAVIYSVTCGTGKSYLAMALVADLCRAGIPATFVPEFELFSRLREFERHAFDIENPRRALDSMRLVVIDDLGTGTVTPFTASELFQLIEGRRRSGKPIVITTNLDPDGVVSQYGEWGKRITSRLVELTGGGENWIDMEGPDVRCTV